jgi:hypothetical protein
VLKQLAVTLLHLCSPLGAAFCVLDLVDIDRARDVAVPVPELPGDLFRAVPSGDGFARGRVAEAVEVWHGPTRDWALALVLARRRAPARRHAILSTSTQSAYLAAQELDGDRRGELREALNRFVRFYGFLSQALPWIPPETEVLFQFSKVLLARLRSDVADGGVDLSGTVTLTHYRLSSLDEASIDLTGDAKPLAAITGDGTGSSASQGEIPMSLLGELVELFNEQYGADLDDADALKVVTDVRDAVRETNPELADQARANSRDDFVVERDDLLIGAALTVETANAKRNSSRHCLMTTSFAAALGA